MDYKNKRINVVGNLSVGKSTICNVLSDLFIRSGTPCMVVREKRDKAVFQHYYESMDEHGYSKNAFEVELRTLSDRTIDHKQSSKFNGIVISDRSIWCNRVFSSVSLTAEEQEVFSMNFDIVTRNIDLPDVVIYLVASPKTLYERNHIRSMRDSRDEESGIALEYFEKIHEAYETQMDLFHKEHPEIPILKFDWTNYGDVTKIVDKINELIK